ncbi:hypothetical protein GQ55_5G351700 [Panicum hallii var. hallii]|uniref:Uncharacterized protein n=1 Tax=Panicum hallii var. hallii TaxID=1504633 RepID=A0A2T7DMD3_9POAL|nr:hypothetical protein GQ55_5G351700 [Panicum hallii var. hallii]
MNMSLFSRASAPTLTATPAGALSNANAANGSTGEASENPLSGANLWSGIQKKWLLAAPSSHLPSSSGGAAGESESREGEGAGGGSKARGGGADGKNEKSGTCHSLGGAAADGGDESRALTVPSPAVGGAVPA